jgi:XTP/dITP diphosphohydrolase
MFDILFASHNLGKVKEVQTLLSPLNIRVLSPADVHIPRSFDVEEAGKTFAENAELKARGFAKELKNIDPEKAAHTLVVSDDSGLMVDALNGQPGVHSKRFVPGTSHDRNQAIIEKLSSFRDFDDRVAHFVTVFCLYQPSQMTDGKEAVSFYEGKIDGEIAFAERGNEGFDYDWIFIPEGYQQTFGELGTEFKNSISHRAKAAQQLITFLKEKYE